MMAETEDIIVGSVVKPHGVRGEIAVDVHTDFPAERFAPGQLVKVRRKNGEETDLEIEQSRPHSGRVLLKLAGVNGREAAETLRSCDLVIAPENVMTLPEGEYYAFQLMSLEVRNQDGGKIGRIREIHEQGSNPVLEIETVEGETLDFPAAGELIDLIDLEAGFIRLSFPAGWRALIR